MSPDERIECRAAQWLARLDAHPPSEEILVDFADWCRADARNLAAYLRLLEAWQRMDALRGSRADSPPREG